jgi:4-aminobutyrate--pyruvate transaminase
VGGVELVADKKTKRSFDPTQGVGAQMAKFAEGHGAILRAMGDTIGFCPPMIITEAELNELFDRTEKALDDAEAWVGKGELRAA